MCKNHIKTYCAGGLLLENSLVCTGHKTIEFAQSINTDLCFLSCKGVTPDGTFTDTSEEETAIRRAFMNRSRTRVLLMTGNKIGTSYLHTLCTADEIDYMFSDRGIPEEIANRMRQ